MWAAAIGVAAAGTRMLRTTRRWRRTVRRTAETIGNSTLANVADDGNTETNNTAQNENQSEKYAVDVWPELGVSTYSGEHDGTKGLVVVNIKPGSVAEKAGLSAGDVILKFDGQPTPDEAAMDSPAGFGPRQL